MDFIYSHYALIVFPLIAVMGLAAYIAGRLKTLFSKIIFAVLTALTMVCLMALPIHAWQESESDSLMGIVLTIALFALVAVSIRRK